MNPLPRPMHLPLDREDEEYVRRHYCSLHDSCFGRKESVEQVREGMLSGILPLPSYMIGDIEMVPYDYFLLLDAAGSLVALKEEFFRRYNGLVSVSNGSEVSDGEAAWEGYLSGGFGVCLWSVIPENIFLKERAMAQISELLENPKADYPSWNLALKIWVERLDALERPFAKVDRQRFGGSVSRDRLITAPMEEFPLAFAAQARTRTPVLH